MQQNRSASASNLEAYNHLEGDYIDGAPHLKHSSLRRFYEGIVGRIYGELAGPGKTPTVLDLGAGEGTATLPFLQLGAHVTAVDISTRQLEGMRAKLGADRERLTIVEADVMDFLATNAERYDVIVANSFLHHVPDYLGMIEQAVTLLAPGGRFFSFQDPLRYDTLGKGTRMFFDGAYFCWRITQADVIGGLQRRFRRSRGVYLDVFHDNVEYHVVRNGVDQDAIVALLTRLGMRAELLTYFSTQLGLFQRLGEWAGVRTHFGIIAERPAGH